MAEWCGIGLSNLYEGTRPVSESKRLGVVERKMTYHDSSEREPATPARRKGALALVGAWREVNEKELESLIEEIYASRNKDVGRRVELEV